MSERGYNPEEMMVVAASRLLEPDDVVFIGIGLPSKAANLARKTHAPELSMIYESGTLDTKPTVLPLSIGDPELSRTAKAVVSVPEMFNYWLQGGWIRTGFLGAAQIDRFGNLNSTVIGDYSKPKVRLPGAGGAPEIASFCHRTLVLLRQNPRTFVEKLDFMTTVGMLRGGSSRQDLKVPGHGPQAVITDLGILEPEAESGELVLDPPPSGGVGRGRDRGHQLATAGRGRAQRDGGALGEGARDPPRPGALREVERRRADPGSRRSGLRRDFMPEAFLCDATRTPVGRYGGALAGVRTDDLAAIPMRALLERNPNLDVSAIDDVVYGCANQAGEDNRNVARMALLLAGFPAEITGTTVNRLCGSGMDAIGIAARAIKAGEQDLVIAGGVESMSRAPFVMGKATAAFSRQAELFDTTIGWRFVNPLLEKQYGVDSMPETAENVAEEFEISREDQDRFAAWSQAKAEAAMANGNLAEEITAVTVPRRKQDPLVVDTDEHPRPGTTVEKLAKLQPFVRENGTVTAGNASGVNDGACALLVASEAAAKRHGLTPLARVVAMSTAGVAPAHHGICPGARGQKDSQLEPG